MTKKEKTKLAFKCGFEYRYSGNTNTGEFHPLLNIHNMRPDVVFLEKFNKMVEEEGKPPLL